MLPMTVAKVQFSAGDTTYGIRFVSPSIPSVSKAPQGAHFFAVMWEHKYTYYVYEQRLPLGSRPGVSHVYADCTFA